jgi:LPXTG-motif cell wall-anchored protein
MDTNLWMQQLGPWFGIVGIGATLLIGGLVLPKKRNDGNAITGIVCVGGYVLIIFGLAGIVAAAWDFRWPFGALSVIILILAAIAGVIGYLRRRQFRMNRFWPFKR